MKNIDLLAIGDIVTDAFIRLEDAEVNCKLDNVNCELCVRYGDKVPYESVEICPAVGNCANAAVSGARLGLSSALLAYIGDDQNGRDCLESLRKDSVILDYVRTEAGKKTNYHYVLWYDVDRTILVKHENFSYDLGDVVAPKWLYLTSLGENTLDYHMQIADFIEKNPETKLAFQPGTFQIKMGKEKLERLYKESDIFVCNLEEAELILGEKTREPKILMQKLRELGPKTIILTDGFNGAYADDGTNSYFMPIYPHTPKERTGAGDAYASTIVSALAMGKTLEEALTWAPINSMSVVQQVGAQKGLLSQEQIQDFLSKAPADYRLQTI